MRRVLKDTGSIYLHCDPTASYYLRLILDVIFGQQNYVNELIWHYRKWTNAASHFQKNHDVILFYRVSNKNGFTFNEILVPPAASQAAVIQKGYNVNKVESGTKLQLLVYDWEKVNQRITEGKLDLDKYDFVVDRHGKNQTKASDVWEIQYLHSQAKERLGYPTQKPLSLLERIIKASTNEGDLVLDPFCGCGTTVHAAESLKRNWIGIDISTFSVGLIKERILNNFQNLKSKDIEIHGTPYNLTTAIRLAKRNPFDFEKWACGSIGAHGMFHNPGDRGADKGVDGVINFARFKGLDQKAKKEYAIVQVKGGKVTSDSVGRLYSTVKKFDATAGIFVCFEKYMKTVENEKITDTFKDLTGTYPVIQGFSVEQLLNNEKPLLPPLIFRKDAKLKNASLF